jgi:C4-dicarboxylate transporter DctM subunit
MEWAMIALPLVLLVLGFPIFLLLLATCVVVLVFFSNDPATVIHQVMFGSVSKFALLAVPFFIFAGEMMSRGGVSIRLVNWVGSIVGGVKGALPLTVVGTATVFGAISGSTAATVAAVGSLTYGPLREKGYDESFAAGMLTSAGAIANIIPPSIAMILYAYAAEASVVDLFAAGIVPGLLLAACFGLYIVWYARRRGIREVENVSWRGFLEATKGGIWALGAPGIILGGIYSGVFAPTEAAGIACIYAMFVTVCIYREATWRDLYDVAANSVYLTAQIFIIVAFAGVYSWLLTVSGAANGAVALIEGWNLPPWAVLLVINIFLLLVGTVPDTLSAILVLTPLLAQIADSAGVDLDHFGIVVVMNLSIGTFTPPFGLNIFVAQAVFKVPLAKLYPGLTPFILISIGVLAIVTYVPGLSLWVLKFLY